MRGFRSRLDYHSAMSWKPEVDGIEKRRQLAAKLGGEEAVAKQHELGRLTIRERIDTLVDAGSFREQGGIAGEPEYGEDGELIGFAPANYVLGLAKLDGRPCAVGGEDFTQRGGSPSPSGLRKSVYAEELACRFKLPLIRKQITIGPVEPSSHGLNQITIGPGEPVPTD